MAWGWLTWLPGHSALGTSCTLDARFGDVQTNLQADLTAPAPSTEMEGPAAALGNSLRAV